jgi:hypothetical protein
MSAGLPDDGTRITDGGDGEDSRATSAECDAARAIPGAPNEFPVRRD